MATTVERPADDATVELPYAREERFRPTLGGWAGRAAFVLAIATRELGARAIGMTAVSPSLPPGELDGARQLAAEIGAEHRVVASNEMADPRYVANQPDRWWQTRGRLPADVPAVSGEQA